MLILGEIVKVLKDLTLLRDSHKLTICYILAYVHNDVSDIVESPLAVMWMYNHVLLDQPRKTQHYVDLLKVSANKCTSGINYPIGNVDCLEYQLVLVVDLQRVTKKGLKRPRDRSTVAKI